MELTNLGQNVNLNVQNDADDDGDGGDNASTTHPSWQVPRAHHAQGPNIPFGESLTLMKKQMERIEQLEEEKMELLRLKQQAIQKVHEVIRETLEEDLTRRILYSILTSSDRLDINDLSEMLNIREKEIKKAMKELENKFSITLKYFYSNT